MNLLFIVRVKRRRVSSHDMVEGFTGQIFQWWKTPFVRAGQSRGKKSRHEIMEDVIEAS